MAVVFQFDFNYVYSSPSMLGPTPSALMDSNPTDLPHTVRLSMCSPPDMWRAPSDFDTTHQLNANWVWDVPYGLSRHRGSGAKV